MIYSTQVYADVVLDTKMYGSQTDVRLRKQHTTCSHAISTPREVLLYSP